MQRAEQSKLEAQITVSRGGRMWQVINTQDDLNAFDRVVCWEDSETVEYYATRRSEKWFPPDVNRSGHLTKNVYLLCRACSRAGAYLEMVWIACDEFSSR